MQKLDDTLPNFGTMDLLKGNRFDVVPNHPLIMELPYHPRLYGLLFAALDNPAFLPAMTKVYEEVERAKLNARSLSILYIVETLLASHQMTLAVVQSEASLFIRLVFTPTVQGDTQ